MRISILVMVAAIGVGALGVGKAQAIGCVSGAAAGGIAGHVAHHHAVLGAVGGCIVGHEMNKHDKKQAALQAQQNANSKQ